MSPLHAVKSARTQIHLGTDVQVYELSYESHTCGRTRIANDKAACAGFVMLMHGLLISRRHVSVRNGARYVCDRSSFLFFLLLVWQGIFFIFLVFRMGRISTVVSIIGPL